jgi:hypothetical protein
MMDEKQPKRILSLDVHPLSFGFVVIQGSDQVLDWGARCFRHGVNAVKVPMRRKLARLIEDHRPEVLVVGAPRPEGTHRLRAIVKVALGHHLPLRMVGQPELKRVFLGSNKNMDDIARAVGQALPQLLPFIPPKRRCWKPEHYRMSVFKAAAAALTYLSRRRE